MLYEPPTEYSTAPTNMTAQLDAVSPIRQMHTIVHNKIHTDPVCYIVLTRGI